jgi:antitoxin (DNA-binding transcriptional repressor) of toxin-antitoxin stability system
MKTVGIRELKNRLSEYIRLVRTGETILVTDRGEVVAELRPPGTPTAEDSHPLLTIAVREGRVRAGASNRPDLYPELGKVLPEGTALRWLDESRADR